MTIRMVVKEKTTSKGGDMIITDIRDSDLTPKGNLSRYLVYDLLRYLEAGRYIELRKLKGPAAAPGQQLTELTDTIEPGADLAPLEIHHSSNCTTRTGGDCDCEDR